MVFPGHWAFAGGTASAWSSSIMSTAGALPIFSTRGTAVPPSQLPGASARGSLSEVFVPQPKPNLLPLAPTTGRSAGEETCQGTALRRPWLWTAVCLLVLWGGYVSSALFWVFGFAFAVCIGSQSLLWQKALAAHSGGWF